MLQKFLSFVNGYKSVIVRRKKKVENFQKILKNMLDFKNLWSTIYIVPGSWRLTSAKGNLAEIYFILFKWQLH